MEKLKDRAKRLKAEVKALYYAAQDPRLPWTARAVILFALGYALSPIDLIPDFIPVLGYLDDLLVLPALIALALRLVPAEVMAAARDRAAREPVSLRKNWLFASLFALFWIAVLALIILALIRFFSPTRRNFAISLRHPSRSVLFPTWYVVRGTWNLRSSIFRPGL